MRESLEEPVSVVFYYDASRRHLKPYRLHWQGQDYTLGKIDFWHKTYKGTALLHHFSMGDNEGRAYFKLCFDSTNLHWTIEEYMTADQIQYGRA